MKKNNNKRIVIFSAYIPPHVGGIERYIENVVKQFNTMGWKSIIVTSNYNNELEYQEEEFGEIIRLPVYNIFMKRYPIIKINKRYRKLMKLLDNYDIKRVIVNTRFHLTTHVGVRYANKREIPIYLIEHGSNYVTLNNKFIDFFANRYEEILTYIIKRKVTGVYGVSEAAAKWLVKFGIKADGVWYNSVNINNNLVKKSHQEINIMYAGRIIKQKGIDNILEAFSMLVKKYNNINLYIAGDGGDLEYFKNNYQHKKIKFLGKLQYDELVKYYIKSDIFLYPPLWPEGLPTSILEAGMYKLAVIATDSGGITEIIDNGDNGIIVDKDVDSLYRAMEELINNKRLRDKYGNNLYKTVCNKFSWDKNVKKMLKDMGIK